VRARLALRRPSGFLVFISGALGLVVWANGWAQVAQSGGSGDFGAKSIPPATSNAGTPQPAAAQTIRVTSRETVVDITVTDSKGQPIHGLTASDFAVKEDGSPQVLKSFREVREDDPPVVSSPPRLPDLVYSNIQPPPTTSAVNILLLDGLNTLPADQVNMRQESLKYLKSMPPGTRVAVLGLGSSLRILQGFTANPSVLIAAVDSKKNRALPSPFVDTDTGAVLDDQADAQTELGNDDAAAAIQEFSNEQAAVQQDIRMKMTLEALDQIAAYVASVKGRKNLIWFTDGMPLNIYPTGGINDLSDMTDYNKEVRETTDLLTASEVAVYPVDARKLFTNPATGADQHMERITVNSGSRVAASEQAFQQKKSTEILGMEAVAEGTGGVAYYNTNDLKTAVAKAIANGSNYYSLSYAPPDFKFDGRYHSINVSASRPDSHLSYRKGYNADDIVHNQVSPELSLAIPDGGTMAAAMERGVPTSSQILFDVRVAPATDAPRPDDPAVVGTLDPKLAGKRLVRYDVIFIVPSRQLTFADGGDGLRKVSLEFDVSAYDVYGKLISTTGKTFAPPPLNADQYQRFLRDKPPFFQQIDLPPGETFLRVGVLDKFSARTGTLEIPLQVSGKLARASANPGGNVAK
jgi:VWFA-related protein